MNKKKFIKYNGKILPLDISNVDTDNIIPKQFLKATTRSNFGKYLFFNWRFLKHTINTPNSNFILNNPDYKNSSILLTRKNFGCGSSREHAVWALIDYGFRVIIASSFADIFYRNSFNNHLLLVILSELEINDLFEETKKNKHNLFATINILNKTISTKNKTYSFKINDIYQNYIINNLDKIDITLKYKKNIQKYEDNQFNFLK